MSRSEGQKAGQGADAGDGVVERESAAPAEAALVAVKETRRPPHIVCLGAASGGSEALQGFFAAMPLDTGAAFIAILHPPTDLDVEVPEVLARNTALPITVASDGTAVQGNAIYLIPPGKHMVYADGRLHLHDQDRTTGHAVGRPIDILFESIAQACGCNSIGIILSGAGGDGCRGVRALKDAGAIVLAQDPESSRFDGMPRGVLDTGVVDSSGTPALLALLVAEMTRQRPLAATLFAADLDNILANVDVGTLLLDTDLRIREFTPGMERVVGLVENDIGRPIDHLAHNLGANLVDDATRAMHSGESAEREMRGTLGNWLLVKTQPSSAHLGQSSGAVVTIVDVTPIKNAQEMTRITNEQLVHANERQREELEDLFSIVAHDLKRPVVALDGLLKMVERAGQSREEDGREFIARALVECQRMRRMLEDLSSLSAGTRRESLSEEVELEAWLDALLSRYRPISEESSIQLNCACDSGRVRMPRGALEETVVNLLENAFNYGCSGPNPRIDVACRLGWGTLVLSVRDNGKGIAPENHRKIFEPFRRLDPEMADGSGVGLVAARRLIGRHGGVISIESDTDQGAEFIVRLPVEADRWPARESAARQQILVVEDDTLDAKAIERALGEELAVTRAKDLAGAIALLSQARYDLVVLDLSLPDGHGLELVRHLRTELQLDTPVIVVTGHGNGISPTATTSTITGFVAKSELRSDTLRAAVSSALAHRVASA